jgi:hypothetical protein
LSYISSKYSKKIGFDEQASMILVCVAAKHSNQARELFVVQGKRNRITTLKNFTKYSSIDNHYQYLILNWPSTSFLIN